MINVDNLDNPNQLTKSEVFDNTDYGLKALTYFIKVSSGDFNVDLKAFKQNYPKCKISKASQYKVTITVEGMDAKS